MTSLPNSLNFNFGTPSSVYSVRDAIQSYRRSAYLSVNANVASSPSSASRSLDADDEESALGRSDEENTFEDDDDDRTPGAHDGQIADFEWDELDATPGPSQRYTHEGPGELLPVPEGALLPTVPEVGLSTSPRATPPVPRPATEATPLLRKTVSFSQEPHPYREQHPHDNVPVKQRRQSAGSAKSVKYVYTGKSTFGQTLFNSIAILLGIGMLSEPLAFAYAGWIGGTLLIISYGLITCYTAKILGRIILSDHGLRSYADIGRKAFGPRSIPFISTMFCLELFAVSVALVTLSADSLHSILPAHSANTYKIWGLLILIPTVFMPLSLLSYTSILGITSTLFIVAVIFIDGFIKKEAPGSLWSPAETSLSFGNVGELGISFGLFMAGFSGHAVIPSLARDMIDPSQFDKMIDWAFMIATTIYAIIGCAGYLMFGHSVHDEVSVDLLGTPGFPPLLNKLALWTFVISPLSKFALATRPVNITLEIMFGLEPRSPPTAPDDHSAKPRTLTIHGHPPNEARLNLRRAGIVVERVLFAALSVAVSVAVPEFSSMMAFIGSFSAFLLCVIGPLAAKIALERRCGVLDGVILASGIVMAVWGTGAAFWAAGTGEV